MTRKRLDERRDQALAAANAIMSGADYDWRRLHLLLSETAPILWTHADMDLLERVARRLGWKA